MIDPGGTVSARYDERLLSRSKQAYLYAAGAAGVVIDVHGVRLGLASGLGAPFPQVFSDYESQDVDCVLFSTAGPGDATEADTLASSVRTHALQNGLWIGYAVPSDKAPYAAAGVIAPGAERVGGPVPEPGEPGHRRRRDHDAAGSSGTGLAAGAARPTRGTLTQRSQHPGITALKGIGHRRGRFRRR